MKKTILLFLAISLSSITFAQYIWDYGVMVGASNYLGEIGGKEKTRRDFILDLKLSQTKSAFGGFARYKYNSKFFFRGSAGWYRISGDDKLSTNPGRRGRNLSFKNDIYELSGVAQYVFYSISDIGRSYRYRNDFKAYVFTGLAASMHNPQAKYQGSWVDLAPLHTEGQGIVEGAPKPYGKYIAAIPAGAGFFFTINKVYRIGWEFNWRTTFSDYLDDVSTNYVDPSVFGDNQMAIDLANRNPELQPYDDNSGIPDPLNYYPHVENGTMVYPKRGDPKHNDSYLTTTVSASYVLQGKSKFAKVKYKSFFKSKKFSRRTIRAKF
jgi:hypothetical protein